MWPDQRRQEKGAENILGIDIDQIAIDQDILISKILGNQNKAFFTKCNVFDLLGSFDFGICAGGLYHLSNPQDLLKLLREKIGTALIIQTVYSLAESSPDYFETPAPHWTWGCRFSYSYLLETVEKAGWKIVDACTNELEGNERLEDRGSAYLLCEPS